MADVLLGIRDTSFSGRKTRKDRNIRRSTSILASANIVMALFLVISNSLFAYEHMGEVVIKIAYLSYIHSI